MFTNKILSRNANISKIVIICDLFNLINQLLRLIKFLLDFGNEKMLQLSVSELQQSIDLFSQQIGDLQQGLSGQDWSLDPLLCKADPEQLISKPATTTESLKAQEEIKPVFVFFKVYSFYSNCTIFYSSVNFL